MVSRSLYTQVAVIEKIRLRDECIATTGQSERYRQWKFFAFGNVFEATILENSLITAEVCLEPCQRVPGNLPLRGFTVDRSTRLCRQPRAERDAIIVGAHVQFICFTTARANRQSGLMTIIVCLRVPTKH